MSCFRSTLLNSALHKYSDPVGVLNGKAIGQNGKGFEGDFEFRVMSCSKDSVVLEVVNMEIVLF